MQKFVGLLGDQTFPVIGHRRRPRYVNGEKTNILDSIYVTLQNYEQVVIAVEDDGTVVSEEQVKKAADNGTPVEMEFKNVELTFRGTRNPWELQVSGRASQAAVVKGK